MLIRLGPDRHRLVITNHHILLDGWSTPLLLRELFALYRAGGSAEGLPRVTPFRDYLGWLRRQDGQAAEAAWREALQGLEEPTRLAPRRSTAAAMPETVSVALTAERTAALTRQARRLGLTVNTLVQGAWGILLGRLTGRDDVVFGVTVSGRPAELPGIEAMVGLLINTLPLRLRLRPAEPLAAFLARLQEEQSRLLAHQHLGLTRIQQIAGFPDLFDTLLVFENYPMDRRSRELGDLRPLRELTAAHRSATSSHYPLGLLQVLPGEQHPAALRLPPGAVRPGGRGRSDRHPAATCAAGIAVISDPSQRRRCRIELAGVSRSGLVCCRGGMRGALRCPAKRCRTLFEAQVRRTPDAVALVLGEEVGQLRGAEPPCEPPGACADLREAWVPRSVVGIALPRSVSMVVSVLGVLKAGAAYLPLDPEYPAERLGTMVVGCGAASA